MASVFVFLPELPRAADQNVCKQSWAAQAELCYISLCREGRMLSLAFVVRFGHVRPFFGGSGSQEFNSDIGAHKKTRQCALGPILRHIF